MFPDLNAWMRGVKGWRLYSVIKDLEGRWPRRRFTGIRRIRIDLIFGIVSYTRTGRVGIAISGKGNVQ